MTIYTEEREIPDWPEWTEAGAASTLDAISPEATRAVFYREKASHRGISARSNLQELIATKVHQDFLDEICELGSLHYLELHDVTAQDLAPITSLRRLKTLKVSGIRRDVQLDVFLRLPKLKKLFIEDAKHMTDLEFLSDAHHLRSIGVEGSMWAVQKVDALKPLAGLCELDALFMVGVRLKDKDLSGLASCPKLRVLQCARFAPKANLTR